MSLVFTPSNPLPSTGQEVEDAVWYCVWDHPWDSWRMLAPGAVVLLYDAQREAVVWEVELADVITVPFESTDAFRDHVALKFGRWVTPVDDGPSPGWGVAFTARALRRLDILRPPGAPAMEEWACTGCLDDSWRDALGVVGPRCGS